MENKTLKAIMSKDLLCVEPETSLEEAYFLLRSHWIRHLPVVDKDQKIVGVISDRDFASVKITGVGPTVASRAQVRFPFSSRVKNHMSDQIFSVSINDDLKMAIDLMLMNKISSCLITDNEHLMGIITTDDLLRLLKTYIDSPKDSLRTRLEVMLKTSPLGTMGDILANAGI